MTIEDHSGCLVGLAVSPDYFMHFAYGPIVVSAVLGTTDLAASVGWAEIEYTGGNITGAAIKLLWYTPGNILHELEFYQNSLAQNITDTTFLDAHDLYYKMSVHPLLRDVFDFQIRDFIGVGRPAKIRLTSKVPSFNLWPVILTIAPPVTGLFLSNNQAPVVPGGLELVNAAAALNVFVAPTDSQANGQIVQTFPVGPGYDTNFPVSFVQVNLLERGIETSPLKINEFNTPNYGKYAAVFQIENMLQSYLYPTLPVFNLGMYSRPAPGNLVQFMVDAGKVEATAAFGYQKTIAWLASMGRNDSNETSSAVHFAWLARPRQWEAPRDSAAFYWTDTKRFHTRRPRDIGGGAILYETLSWDSAFFLTIPSMTSKSVQLRVDFLDQSGIMQTALLANETLAAGVNHIDFSPRHISFAVGQTDKPSVLVFYIMDQTGTFTESEKIRVEFDWQFCGPNGSNYPNQLVWLNSLGGWDSFTFYQTPEVMFDVSTITRQSTFSPTLKSNNDYSPHSRHEASSKSSKMGMILRSNSIVNETYEWLRDDLGNSPEVYLVFAPITSGRNEFGDLVDSGDSAWSLNGFGSRAGDFMPVNIELDFEASAENNTSKIATAKITFSQDVPGLYPKNARNLT
jgi:hypothetical protein